MRKPAARRAQGGFTLLELMVALAVLGLLSVMLFGGLRFGFRSWERESAHANAVSDIGIAQSFLRHSIANAYPMFQLDGEGKRVNPFIGSTESLEFLAPTPTSAGGGGKDRYRLGAVTVNGRTDLVVWSQPELALNPEKRSMTILVPGVSGVAFKYFGKQTGDGDDQWYGDWQDASRLPQLVRVQVSFVSDDFRVWPEFVVAPRIALDANCVYDPLTQGCKGR